MGLEPEYKIGDKVYNWTPNDPKERVRGVVTDYAMGSDLCTYEEDTGNEYDESDDACGFEHDNWYIKVRLSNGEETEWEDEYYWRGVD